MTTEQYREEGFRLYDEDIEKAVECLKKAAEDKDVPSAVALAGYYYDEEDDYETAKEWLEKAFKWNKKSEKTKEFSSYIALAHTLMGQILYYDEFEPSMAFIEFAKGAEQGHANAYEYLGLLLYEGDFTHDGNPDVNGALDFWQKGMEEGDEGCTELYEEHKDEIWNDPQEIDFENGDHYHGDVNAKGQPHGGGHMDYNKNGYYSTYDGQWKNGKRCGQGHYHEVSKSGRRYVYDYKGEWLDDKEHGTGTAMNSSEKGAHCATVTETYTGGFREGKRHGYGVIVEDNFDGNFKDGQNRFEGEFEDGKTIGHGRWEYANGDSFEGEFSDYGNKNGHGVYTFANGLKFEGEWEKGHFLTESYQADPSQETPTLLITEHHHGFDYNYTGTFLFAAKVGQMDYEQAAVIHKDQDFPMKGACLNIIEVTSDSVTYEVKAKFTKGTNPFNDTIHKGETKDYQFYKNSTATIYDEDYDYSIESRLTVICK